MKKVMLVITLIMLSIAFINPHESSADSGNCYVKAFSHGEETCFVCVTSETSQVCSEDLECGDEFCWKPNCDDPTVPCEN